MTLDNWLTISAMSLLTTMAVLSHQGAPRWNVVLALVIWPLGAYLANLEETAYHKKGNPYEDP
jgi:hypothetical protein